jgi:hypothetical protein
MMRLITNKLAVGAVILFFSIAIGASYYLYQKGFKAKEREVIIQQQENYIQTRRRIDEATSDNRSVSDALDRLRVRQRERSK